MRVLKRLLPGDLRAQLALAIALVTIVAVAASFIALYRGTSARLQALQTKQQLGVQALSIANSETSNLTSLFRNLQ